MGTPQTVTVLFTDLVGSTELLSALDPPSANALREEHFALLRGTVTVAGGHEVKNLGDGLMVAFSSLSRALACAVSMQQALERRNRRAEHEIAIRVGLATGEATEEDGDYFGEPVVEAARLCAYAGGGQILTTGTTRLLAGRHATQEFAPLGLVALKGLPEPVDVLEVRWAPELEADAERGQVALPTRLVAASAESLFAFFGRSVELDMLAQLHKHSSHDRHLDLVLISGEPGVGKTSLLAQASRDAHFHGSNVLYGGCEEDLGLPYKPWVEALSPLVDALPDEFVRDFVDANGPTLGLLVPALNRRIAAELRGAATAADSQEQFMLIEAVVRFLTAISELTPIFLVLDDLHWADAASLQLLGHLIRSATPMRVTIVGTFRDSDVSRSHPLAAQLANFRRQPSVQRMELSGLDDVELVGLMEAAAGHSLPPEGVALAHALRRETNGNPFFVVELIRHLWEEGIFVESDDGTWRLSVELEQVGLPSSVREVVGHRVALLGDRAEQTLSTASVIGREFDVGLLADVLGDDQLAVIDILEAAIAAGLISESSTRPGLYRFVHALIQHTLYQDLSTARRQRTHERIAECLEQSSARDSEALTALAHHYLAATRPARTSKAVEYARKAGQAALQSYAPSDAARWFSEAIDALDRQPGNDDEERCRLLVDLGTAEALAGRPDARSRLLEAAREAWRLGLDGELVTAVLATTRGTGMSQQADVELVELARGALSRIDERDATRRARLLAALSELDWQNRLEWANKAAEAARSTDDDLARLAVITSTYELRAEPSSLEDRLSETARAVQIAEASADLANRFRARWIRMNSCVEAGLIDEVDQQLAVLTEIAGKTGLPLHAWYLGIARTWRCMLNGDYEEAERWSAEALELGMSSGQPEAMATFGAQLFEMKRQQGRVAEVVDTFAAAMEAHPEIPVLRSVMTIMMCELGRYDEARAILESELRDGFASYPLDFTWTSSMCLLLDGAVTLEHAGAASRLLDALRPYPRAVVFNNGTVLGVLARVIGRAASFLGDPEGIPLLRQALETHERLRAPFFVALTQLDLAEALERDSHGEPTTESATLRSRALATSEQHALAALRARARAKAR